MWVGSIVEGEIGYTITTQVYEGAEFPLSRYTHVSILGDYETELPHMYYSSIE